MMEIRKSLETNFLTCKHCLQPYKQPKALVCLHSFCQSCLEDIISKRKAEEEAKEIETIKLLYKSTNSTDYPPSGYRRKWSSRFRYGDYSGSSTSNYNTSRYTTRLNSKDDVIKCPVCQKETIIPSGGVNNLPADQLADKLASMVDRMPNFPICDVCTKEPLLTESDLVEIKYRQQSNGTLQIKQSEYGELNRYTSEADTLSEEDEGVSLDKHSLQDSMDNSDVLNSHKMKVKNYNYKQNGHETRRSRKRTVSGYKSDDMTGPHPAIAACLECGKRLCNYCKEAHSKMSVTTNHVLIQVEQMDDLRCDKHPRELRRFFCLTCRTYICIICAFEITTTALTNSNDETNSSNNHLLYTGHADHDILSIRQAVAAYQDQINLKSAETQTQIDQIEMYLNGLQICETEMRYLHTLIETTAMNYIEYINKQKHQLCEQLDNLIGIQLNQLTNECSRLNAATEEWYNFLNDDCITSRLDLMDPIEALTEAGPMLDRLNQCLQLASNSILNSNEWKPLLLQLTNAEKSLLNQNYNFTHFKQNLTNNHNEDDNNLLRDQDPRIQFWRSRLGKFEPGEINLGRLVTPNQLNLEAKFKACQFISTHSQTGPELIKTLPPPKGALLHRAIQVDLSNSNLEDRGTQTEIRLTNSNLFHFKVNTGTQYLSSDFNPPVSIYRSIKQILVQK